MKIIKKILMVLPNYIRRKIFYHSLKKVVFESFDNADSIIKMFTNLAISVKDLSPDEVKKEFMSTLAEVIHNK